MNLQNMLQFKILGNSGGDYLIALAVLVGALIVLKIFREVILSRLKKAAEKTKTDLDDVLIKIIHDITPPFYLIISVYASLKFLKMPAVAEKIVDGVFILAIVLQAVRALQVFIDYWTQKLVGRRIQGDEAKNKAAVKSISSVLKFLLWLLAALVVLSNWGIDITSLIAGLGIGGIAVAFALQNVLGDIFSSFSILFDKPFQVGDFIIVGGDMGVVERIGIKSTRIRTLQGQELVVSNRELTDARVNNYKKMEKRRIAFSFGVLYETPNEKLKKVPEMVKEIIGGEELAELDRVHFKEFGDFSLNFEVVYYVSSPDYNDYMNTQQSINFALKEAFEKEGIEFAYPTQTVFVKK
ncbi:MAG: mechanosensitive ion channel family protein [bacterium]|nr:mechanosensitive ion channel family protein [bacterium]